MNTKTIRANKARLIKGSVIPSYARIMQTATYELFNVSMEEWHNTSFKDINSTTRILNTTNNQWLWLSPPTVLEDNTLKSNRRLPTIKHGDIEIGRYMYLWDTSTNFREVTSKQILVEFTSTSTQFRCGFLSVYNPTSPAVTYMDTYSDRSNELLSAGLHTLKIIISANAHVYYYIDNVLTSREHNINATGNPLYLFFYNMSVGDLHIKSISVEAV